MSAEQIRIFVLPRKLTDESSDDDLETYDIQHQRDIQQAAEDRLRAQRLDEEYARQIQSQESGSQPLRPQLSNAGSSSSQAPAVRSSAPNSAPNAFHRMTGIRPPQVHFQGDLTPNVPSNASLSRTLSPPFKSEPRTDKNSFRMGPSSSHFRPDATAFDSKKERLSMTLLDDSDSDIEIIPSTAFRSNGRHQQAFSARSLAYQDAGTGGSRLPIENEQSALTQALYGAQSSPHPWMDPSQSIGSPGQSTLPDSTGQYVYPDASSVNNVPITPGPPFDSTAFFQPPSETDVGYSGYSVQHTSPGLSSLDYSSANPFKQSVGTLFADLNPFSNGQPSINTFTDINSIANLSAFEAISGLQPYTEHMAEQYDYIMNDPRKTNDEIKSLLENIQPDVDLPKENREGTPDGLKYPLVSL
jgi:hypothetical protein